MCVNYLVPAFEDFRLHFDVDPPTWEYRREVFPGYAAPMLVLKPEHGEAMRVERAKFGLIPFWSKDDKIGRRTYNARSETVATKPSYRGPWRRRQFCIVPVQAFFEPNYESGKAIRWKIARGDGKPFGLAAIWDTWRPAEGQTEQSFSLLTVNAADHPLMRRFHAPDDEKRSVVVLGTANYSTWLTADDEEDARELLSLFDASAFEAEPSPAPARSRSE
ncbi:MAG: SOS response-associated peptidase [Sinobacteraceae bacterium]|nr:SOS response-associated peptidase [Nevskiaceae bacterium]